MRWIVLLALAATACDRQVAGGSTDGAKVFAAACARCHGATGKPPQQMTDQLGVRDLTADEFRGRRSRDLIETQIRRGAASGRMPAFTGALTDAQIVAVAAYVMTLGE
ncbi:MAG: c-type cytochrome [Myxococcales bacterium]|nr:c-type cytochrome [Myxococcales bacterium]